MHEITCISISHAHINMLKKTLEEPIPCLTQVTTVVKPILGNCLNNNENVRAAFEGYTFPKDRTGRARTGRFWIACMHRPEKRRGEIIMGRRCGNCVNGQGSAGFRVYCSKDHTETRDEYVCPDHRFVREEFDLNSSTLPSRTG